MLGAVAAGLIVARLWGGFCLGDKVDGSTSAGVRAWELELKKVLEVYQNPKNVLCAHQHGISTKWFILGFDFPGHSHNPHPSHGHGGYWVIWMGPLPSSQSCGFSSSHVWM